MLPSVRPTGQEPGRLKYSFCLRIKCFKIEPVQGCGSRYRICRFGIQPAVFGRGHTKVDTSVWCCILDLRRTGIGSYYLVEIMHQRGGCLSVSSCAVPDQIMRLTLAGYPGKKFF